MFKWFSSWMKKRREKLLAEIEAEYGDPAILSHKELVELSNWHAILAPDKEQEQ